MKTIYIPEKIKYDGSQLSPHWIYKNFSLLGDAIAAFCGEAEVGQDTMVDLADVKNKDFIYSPLMLNFIIEHFDTDLEKSVYRQRMFMIAIKEQLESQSIPVIRSGDDLYVGKGKLSVSIATRSIVSTLIHVGLNIVTEGTPIKTAGLKKIGITDIEEFALQVMQRYAQELEGINDARCKVRGLAVEI